jgi:phosphoglycolate phosphatase-like HAD superfamily hydrolase
MPYDNIIVDFDGTISDSRKDIARAQLWALERLGRPGIPRGGPLPVHRVAS